jgi:hypothetical protein
MLNSQQPFPHWPLLKGKNASSSMNLFEYVDMNDVDADDTKNSKKIKKFSCNITDDNFIIENNNVNNKNENESIFLNEKLHRGVVMNFNQFIEFFENFELKK